MITATSITSLTVTNNVDGTINVSGDLHTLNLPGGSIDPGAVVTAGSLESAAIAQNMAGQIIVSGTLGSVSVGGATPGSFVAGHVGTISAAAGYGPVVLQVTENGIQRHLEAATPANPYPQAEPVGRRLAFQRLLPLLLRVGFGHARQPAVGRPGLEPVE